MFIKFINSFLETERKFGVSIVFYFKFEQFGSIDDTNRTASSSRPEFHKLIFHKIFHFKENPLLAN